jgi:hypothetical protein
MTSPAETRQRILAHYEQDGLLERIDAGLTALGEDPAKPSLESLSPVDEFHIRGRNQFHLRWGGASWEDDRMQCVRHRG